MITQILRQMFDWPQGIVVGNLIASAMTTALSILHTHLRVRKLHKKIDGVKSNG